MTESIGSWLGQTEEDVTFDITANDATDKLSLPSLFDFLNSVTYDKKELVRNQIITQEMTEPAYPAYQVNRGLSMGMDTILHANEMNRLHGLFPDAQYRYYLRALPRAKRRNKWAKAEKSDTLNLVARHYSCNKNVAREYMKLLTEDDIALIVEKHSMGGQASKSKKKGQPPNV